MNKRTYEFTWDFIGDPEAGRPHLGNTVPVEIYRLFQYTLRDILEQALGAEETDRIFFRSGLLAGREYFKKYIGECGSLDDFISKTQESLRNMSIGILRTEQANEKKLSFVLTVTEDLDCSGLSEMDRSVCTYDEGFIAGLFESFTGKPFSVREVDCWGTGDRMCRFEVAPQPADT